MGIFWSFLAIVSWSITVRCCSFLNVYFYINIILVTVWKHGICPHYITRFNEELENISTEIIEMTNMNESSHEESIVILKQKHEFLFLKEEDEGNWYEFSYSETVYLIIILYSWSLCEKDIHISTMKSSKNRCCTYECCIWFIGIILMKSYVIIYWI